MATLDDLDASRHELRKLLVHSGVNERRATQLARSIWNVRKVLKLVKMGAGPSLIKAVEHLFTERPALPAVRPDSKEEDRARQFVDQLEKHRLGAESSRRALAGERNELHADCAHVRYATAQAEHHSAALVVLAQRAAVDSARARKRGRETFVLAHNVLRNAERVAMGGGRGAAAESKRPELLAQLAMVQKSTVSYCQNLCRIDPRWRCDRAMTRRPVRARGSRKLCIHAQRCVRVPSLGKEPQERSAVRCARDDLVWLFTRRRTNGRAQLLPPATDRGLLLAHQDPPAWIDNLASLGVTPRPWKLG